MGAGPQHVGLEAEGFGFAVEQAVGWEDVAPAFAIDGEGRLGEPHVGIGGAGFDDGGAVVEADHLHRHARRQMRHRDRIADPLRRQRVVLGVVLAVAGNHLDLIDSRRNAGRVPIEAAFVVILLQQNPILPAVLLAVDVEGELVVIRIAGGPFDFQFLRIVEVLGVEIGHFEAGNLRPG